MMDRQGDLPTGILVVDKPDRMTSNAVLTYLKRHASVGKVGHAGTLDPMATGVLPVLCGRATRLSGFLLQKEKEYDATVRFGWATDTWDAEGRPLSDPVPVLLDPAEVRERAESLAGNRTFPLPAFSAAKWQGKPSYYYARKGLECPGKERPMAVFSVSGIRWEPPLLHFHVHCGAGTYIRSLAWWLGEACGTGAHLCALRRTRCGPFSLAQAVTWPEIEKDPLSLPSRFFPLEQVLAGWPERDCEPGEVVRVVHGNPIPAGAGLQEEGVLVSLFAPGRVLLAVGRTRGGAEGLVIHPETVLASPDG